MRTNTPKILAFYLPQFHPIPENDEWWGPGFTEWYNVARARPLFTNHVQPRLPGELGFYDLRLPKTRADQATLATHYGLYGFCYWHYWFAGKRLLELPIEQVLATNAPDLPFCVAWANESWAGVWHGAPTKLLMEQTYPEGDPERHYALLKRFFHDRRYIRRGGRPLLYIYKPREIPRESRYLEILRTLARADGFPNLYIVGTWSPNPGGRFSTLQEVGLDAAVITNITGRDSLSPAHWIAAGLEKMLNMARVPIGPKRIRYDAAVKSMLPDLRRFAFPAYNCVISNWDNTPRSGRLGLVLTHWTPSGFRSAITQALANHAARYTADQEVGYVFLKSWNEWAEGNYVEPDQLYGRASLESIAAAISEWCGRQ